jgi:uncharacterized membrane protein
MHPMVLHLPIGLLLITGLFWFCKQEFEGENFAKLFRFVLAITAITANIAALMGFFLSKEEGYTASLLTWHKYSGIVLSFMLWTLDNISTCSQDTYFHASFEPKFSCIVSYRALWRQFDSW